MILGASFDSPEDNAAFAKKFNFPFLLLCDTDHSLGIAYGAASQGAATPRRISYLIDEAGTITKLYDPVSAKTHPAEVLADLA